MKVLLVEDDEFKQNAITNQLAHLDLSFEVEVSVQGAIDKINHNIYDIIFLDMSLPSHNLLQGKGAPVPMLSGGMEVVMELSYKKRSDKVIVLTQYPEIEIDQTLYSLEEAKSKILNEHEISLLDIIRFKRETSDWQKPLLECIERACK